MVTDEDQAGDWDDTSEEGRLQRKATDTMPKEPEKRRRLLEGAMGKAEKQEAAALVSSASKNDVLTARTGAAPTAHGLSLLMDSLSA